MKIIPNIIKESLLLLIDLFERSKTKSTNVWLQYQKTCILINLEYIAKFGTSHLRNVHLFYWKQFNLSKSIKI